MWEDILPQIDYGRVNSLLNRRSLIDDFVGGSQPQTGTPAFSDGPLIPPRPLSPFVDRSKFAIGSQTRSALPEVTPSPLPQGMLEEQMARARQIQQQSSGDPAGVADLGPIAAKPWYQGALDQLTALQSMPGQPAAGGMASVLPAGPRLDGSVTGAMPYNAEAGWNSLPVSPYGVTDNLMERAPVHTLGVSGFRTGWSRPTVDYSGMQERARIDNQNMRMAEMLGRQEMARNAQSNENVRTAMAVQQRDDAARAMAEQRFFGNLNRVPEGKRTPLISEGINNKWLDKTVGDDMLLDEMLIRARMNAKTGSGVDLKRLLGSVASEFDPNKLSRLDLISKLQRMGYTADQIAAYENDPVVGQFAGSLLSAKPTTRSAREEWESVLFGR